MKILKMSLLILFHPVTAFTYIQKERENFKWYPVPILLGLAIIVRLVSLQFTHYPLSTVGVRTNLIFECAKLFVPLISWGIASYLMTTIMDGETLFRESMLACSYALIPYILIMIPLTLLSQILDINQLGLFVSLEGIALGWVVLLVIISLKVMNHFTGSKTVVIILLSLFTVAMLWVAVALLYTLCAQFIDFVQAVMIELRYRF